MIDDVADLQALEVDAGRRFRALGMDEIADDDPPATELLEAHVGNSSAWVAVEPDGRIVGYALASMVDGEGHLDQVSVADDAGRRGIGTALIEQVCSWTRRQGAVSVTLTTFRDVAFNGPYYESLGFIALDESQCGPELAAIRDNEIDLGLDIAPRVAMRRPLDHPVGRPVSRISGLGRPASRTRPWDDRGVSTTNRQLWLSDQQPKLSIRSRDVPPGRGDLERGTINASSSHAGDTVDGTSPSAGA